MKQFFFGFLILFSTILSSCRKDNLAVDNFSETTVLVYMAGNNDLRADAVRNIIQMQKGISEVFNGTLLVFIKTNSVESHILRIKYSNENKVVSDTVKMYHHQNSANIDFLKKVIEDARQIAPAKKYGLVLWSHATAWLPPKKEFSTKAFGLDDEQEIDVKMLKIMLPQDLEFIAFDACFMGSLEVSYELRGNATYILSSPSEVLSSGYPYDKVTKYFFQGERGLKTIAEQYIYHYGQLNGMYSSATISLIKTQNLSSLASLTKKMISGLGSHGQTMDIDNIQKLFFEFEDDVLSCYDFGDFVRKNFLVSDVARVDSILDNIIIFKGSTPYFFNQRIDYFSGLSVYMPSKRFHALDSYYESLDWSIDTKWNTLFIQ